MVEPPIKNNPIFMEIVFVTTGLIISVVLILVVSKYKKFSIEVGKWFKLNAEK
ncbi:hypothetical protein L21SP5_00420 [Salinivirga cyanobacteriivorans]|uniref:Uncharacterized protein n=1 Tax=Salinivirga cyanobacteriivorans TaxID=1307839 RepID=A0A0S2HVP3_9BACT|nr:hypothetical protein L21SP5_00420 [Salinivirga cyanobacteriivorans]